MKFDGFQWDDGNRQKCQTHGVSVADIESVFSTSLLVVPDIAHSVSEERFKAVGRTATGRWVFLAFSWRLLNGRRLIRPISARYMHAKEIRRYEEMANLEK